MRKTLAGQSVPHVGQFVSGQTYPGSKLASQHPHQDDAHLQGYTSHRYLATGSLSVSVLWKSV